MMPKPMMPSTHSLFVRWSAGLHNHRNKNGPNEMSDTVWPIHSPTHSDELGSCEVTNATPIEIIDADTKVAKN